MKFNDSISIASLEAFKQAWIQAGFSQSLGLSQEIMPRENYAIALLGAIPVIQSKLNSLPSEEGAQAASESEALYCLLMSPCGNASQLGALLLKQGFLSRQAAPQASANFLADLRKRIPQGKL